MSLSVVLFIAAIVVTVLAGFGVRALKRQQAYLEQNGIPLDAEITNLEKGRVSGVIFNSTAYYVGYTYFTSAGGPRRAGYEQISEWAFNQLAVGQTLHILYLPNRPDVSKPTLEYLDEDAERAKVRAPFYWLGGVVIVLLLASFMTLSSATQRQVVNQQATTQKHVELAEIHTALDSKIPAWREAATSRPVRLSAADAGFGPNTEIREVYYGSCRAGSFYTYVIRLVYTGQMPSPTWLGAGYSYTPGTGKAADCAPEGWSILVDTPIEDDWHEVTVDYPAQIPFYRLTETAESPQSKQ